MDCKRPTILERNYGDDRETSGYSKGYNQCTYDARRRKAGKERNLFREFNKFLDYLDDILFQNRRK